MIEDKCVTCYMREVCDERNEYWCKGHDYCDYQIDSSLICCDNCLLKKTCKFMPILNSCDFFVNKKSLAGISEWIIEDKKEFYVDPDEGYKQWISEIVHCKNCGERPCADKRSNYCPNCGKKMINPKEKE